MQLRARWLGKWGKGDEMAKSAAKPKCPLVLLLCPCRFLCVSSPSFWMALGAFGHDTTEAWEERREMKNLCCHVIRSQR